MNLIKHKFYNHKIQSNTEILIVGTFNPDSENNPADFFYGRSKNYLWRLLPLSLLKKDLKNSPKDEKLLFIKEAKIDFIDLISEVNVETGQDTNYKDSYIDDKVTKWKDVITEIKKLKYLKKVYITRKTFSDIPNMKIKIKEISDYCNNEGISFAMLPTPSRFYNKDKQAQWTKLLNNY